MISRPHPGLAAAILAAVVVALAALGLRSGTAGASAPASEPAAATFEQTWMPQLMDHHATAIAMAQLCDPAGVRSELQQVCDAIISAQTQEIGNLQNWLMSWYGQSYTPSVDTTQVQMLEGLSGAAFEKMFMEMMIEHHNMAIMMAQDALANAEHAEILALAQAVITAQSAENQQFQTWLQLWFGTQATPTASPTMTMTPTATPTTSPTMTMTPTMTPTATMTMTPTATQSPAGTTPTTTAMSPPSPTTRVPGPPATGGGTTAGEGGNSWLLLVLGGAVALAGGAGILAFSKSRA